MAWSECSTGGATTEGVKAVPPTAGDFTNLIVQEFANALGLRREGLHMRLLLPLVSRVTSRLAELAVAFDADLGSGGFRTAAELFVSHFIEGVAAAGTERVPLTGPLIIAANHPGVSDALAIAASLPRDDSRLVMSDVPIIRALAYGEDAFILVSGDPDDHVRALRQMIEHLETGGAVILFPSTYLTPDPAHGEDEDVEASFDDWSPSIVLALRRVTGCRLQPVIVSGVLAPRFVRHPLTHLVPAPRGWERQRTAEMLQLMAQLRRENRLGLTPRVTFGEPISAADLGGGRDRDAAMAQIKAQTRALLAAHQSSAGD